MTYYHFIDGSDAGVEPGVPDLFLGGSGQLSDALVGEAHLLGPAQHVGVGEPGRGDHGLELDDLADVVEEPGVDARTASWISRGAEPAPVGLADGEAAVRVGDADLLARSSRGPRAAGRG